MEGFNCDSLDDLLAPYNIYIVDQRGKLDAVKLYFDFKKADLIIDKHRNSLSPDLSVNSNFDSYPNVIPESPKSNKKPITSNKPNRILQSLRRRRRSNGTLRLKAITQFSNHLEKIPALQIQEIRLSKYNPKSSSINPEDLRKLKLTKNESKLRELKVFSGKEFNLQCYHFLVTGIEKPNNPKQNGTQVEILHLESWRIKILEFLSHEDKYTSYFKKLNRWYINECATTELNTVSLQRRDIWHEFLDRNHHGFSVEIVQEHLQFIDSILREHLAYKENKTLAMNEFLLVAKYFVHKNECIIRVLDEFRTILTGHNNQALEEISNMLQSYFSYIFDHKNEFMSISYASAGILPNQRSLTIKEVVGEIESLQLATQLIEEKWFSSYFILDYLYSSHNSIWSPDHVSRGLFLISIPQTIPNSQLGIFWHVWPGKLAFTEKYITYNPFMDNRHEKSDVRDMHFDCTMLYPVFAEIRIVS